MPDINFPLTKKLLTDNLPPRLYLDIEHLNRDDYPKLIGEVEACQNLLKMNALAVAAIKKLNEVHDFYHLELFDYIQIQYHNINLVMLKNKSANCGVSVTIESSGTFITNTNTNTSLLSKIGNLFTWQPKM